MESRPDLDDDLDAPPVAGWARGPLGAVQAADREIARQTAARAWAVAEFAASRPASADRQPGEPGAMGAGRRAARPAVLTEVSEWAVSELSIGLAVSKQAAGQLLERSLTLVRRLPATLAALESGLLHTGHLPALLERVAVVADDEKRAGFERDVLAWVAGRAAKRQVTAPAQLNAKVRRMGLGRDAKQEADELLAALRARGVWARPDRRAGMAVLESLLTAPEAQAVVDALGGYADALDDGPDADGRTRGQQMADVLLDLVLRPGESPLPPVQAQLTLVAGVRTVLGGSAPGEVGGEPVPAEMVRALARALGLLPDPDLVRATTTREAGAREVQREPLQAVWNSEDPRDESWQDWLRADFDGWEAELDARALAGVWGGADDPPPHEQQCWWDEESRWADGGTADPYSERRAGYEDDGSTLAPPRAGPWSAAHAAVDQAGLVLLELDHSLRRASAAMGRAWLADCADERTWQEGDGRIDSSRNDLAALRSCSADRRAELAALLDRTGGGTLVDRPRIAVVDELTGALLALTDSRELRRLAHCGAPACTRRPARCDHDLTGRPGLGPSLPTDGYRPGAVLDRFVRARDRRCRFPGCRRRVPLGGELDHHVPWPEGATSAGNLTGFCTGDHRGKHQAPGWTHAVAPDGSLAVTTPSGLTAVTEPPPF